MAKASAAELARLFSRALVYFGAICFGFGAASAWAQTAQQPAQQPASTQPSQATPAAEAQAWFLRMQTAAARSNFQGTMVFTSGGAARSSRVTHYAVGADVYEMLEALDGQQHRVARHNNWVHMVWPQTRVAVVETRETLAAWSSTPQRVDPAALQSYELRREADNRVAGRTALVFWLQPRDGLRYAQRFWADQETALLLRADVLAPVAKQNAAGVVVASPLEWKMLESTAFSALELNVTPRPQQVLQAMQPGDGYRLLRPQQRSTTLETEGWVLAHPVPGFRLAASQLRGGDQDAKATVANPPSILHNLFTDGLTLVSLFVERYDVNAPRSEALSQQGATASLSQRRGDYWLTVVGDVPPAALKLFAASIDRRGP